MLRVKELVDFIIKNNLMDSKAELVVWDSVGKEYLELAYMLDESVEQGRVVLDAG